MGEPRCDCCWLPISSCGKAAEQRETLRTRQLHAYLRRCRDWLDSCFDGVCAECGEPFKAGTPITRSLRMGQGWRAACCATESEIPA